MSLATQATAHPTLLLIDADEVRAQRLARALTLNDYRVFLATTPYAALERALRTPLTPELVVLGQGDWRNRATELVLRRLFQRMLDARGAGVPVLTLASREEGQIIEASPLSQRTLSPMGELDFALDSIRRMLPPPHVGSSITAARSLVLNVLPTYGLQPRTASDLLSRNSHFRQILQAACEVIGREQWEALITDVGLGRYRLPEYWPPDDDARDIPAEFISCLSLAVEFSDPADPKGQLYRWSARGTAESLKQHTMTGLAQQVLKRLPRERLMALALTSFTREMNQIRGEDLHAWVQREDGVFWEVQYSNLYTYGRAPRAEPTCAVWVASLDATLALVGLSNAYEVSEIECSCQTQTGHCLFALRPR